MAEYDNRLWCVNIIGPDDIIAVGSYIDAVKAANAFNSWWQDQRIARPLHPYGPLMWATPIAWPYSAESHAESVASPSDEYAWLRALQQSGGE